MDLDFLQKSFEEFNQATLRLQEAYESLEYKFECLNRELEAKNRELEKTIADKEDMKNYLENILESLTSGVVVTDLEGRIRTVNPCVEEFFGIRHESLANSHMNTLFADTPKDQWAPVFHPEFFKSAVGRKLRFEENILEVSGSRVKDRNGRVIGSVYVFRDITRMEKLENMAKRSEKMAAMGEMAANIAHEIRNPLGSIELFASLILKNAGNEKEKQHGARIIASVKNVDNKVSNLLMFTRNLNPMPRRIDIHAVLEEILSFSRQVVDVDLMELSVSYADMIRPHVNADAEMLKQVFLNLILNAFQAMPDGGRLMIETHCREGCLGNGSQAVEIRFSDTGCGIPKENLTRIFDPFFSTKEKGSGLGLAIAHNIIDLHQGVIHVENSAHGGAVFSVFLPLVDALKENAIQAFGKDRGEAR